VIKYKFILSIIADFINRQKNDINKMSIQTTILLQIRINHTGNGL